MTTLDARLFGPGLPPSGQPCAWQPDSGTITWADGSVRLPATGGSVRAAGFDLKGIELSWQAALSGTDAGAAVEGTWALQVLSPVDASRIREAPPPGWQQALDRLASERRSGRGKAGLGWSALLLFLSLPLLLLAAFFVWADDVAGWAARRVPLAQEVKLGDASFAAMKPRLEFLDESPAAGTVREIGARLTQGSAYTYRFHLVRDDSINAFALPGGIVVIHSGLLGATKTPEELAGVLAHEVQHVEQRHSLKGLIKDSGLAALWALATGDLSGAMAGNAARQVISLGFSREAERQADSAGFDALVRAGIDPGGLPDFFATLGKATGSPPELLSTHPASDARRDELGGRLRQLGATRFEPLPYRPWPPSP